AKNGLTIVDTRKAGTFFVARSLISLNGSAVSRMRRICSPVSDSSPSRSLPSVPVTPPTWARSLPPFAHRAPPPGHPHARRLQLQFFSRRRQRDSEAYFLHCG